MKKKNENLNTTSSIREKAEKILAKKSSPHSSPKAEGDNLKLIHELEVHQVELEMQNEELRASMAIAEAATKKYTMLYDFAPLGYFTLDQSGIIRELNINGAIMLGKDRESLTGQNFENLVTQDTRETFSEFYAKILETGEKQTCNARLTNNERSAIYCHLEGVVCEGNDCLIGIIDITELMKAEEILKENAARLRELNATKDKFFSIIAHDLRGPFTGIIGLAGLLTDNVRKRDYKEAGKYAEFIQESSFRAMSLLMNLLEWARLQTGIIKFNPGIINLSEIINSETDLLKDTALQKSILIDKNVTGDIPVFADKAMISNVIRNLVSNAVKFTNPGGKVNISVFNDQNEVRIAISDNGVGIEKNRIGKLFHIEGNQSTKGTNNEEGTGLGLILCKEFVSKHGGRIWVESEPSKGSHFFFTIPQPVQVA